MLATITELKGQHAAAKAHEQKEGEALAKKLRPQEMGPSPYAMQLEPTLKALRELEQARGDARAALGVVDDRGPHHLSDELRAALSRVEKGDPPEPAHPPAPIRARTGTALARPRPPPTLPLPGGCPAR